MIRNRQMTRAELGTVLDWAAAEGWNPGLDDAEAFYSADPEGFFVAESKGEPVAAISVVNHSSVFAFLGLYLCLPSHRGRGLGYALWRHALPHAGNRTVGLDGVPEQQDNYQRSGFAHAGATTRYSGWISGSAHPRVKEATVADIARLIDVEARASRWRKPAFLSAWFRHSTHRKTFVLKDDAGRIGGLATVRLCRSGAKLGPLVADETSAARALLRHTAAEFCDDLTIDVPSTSTALADLCRAEDLTPGFHTARMYKGPAPFSDNPLYGVATLELG